MLRSTRLNDWIECDCCAVNDWSQRHEAPRHDRVSAIDQTTITALLSEEKGRQMRFSFLFLPLSSTVAAQCHMRHPWLWMCTLPTHPPHKLNHACLACCGKKMMFRCPLRCPQLVVRIYLKKKEVPCSSGCSSQDAQCA